MKRLCEDMPARPLRRLTAAAAALLLALSAPVHAAQDAPRGSAGVADEDYLVGE